MHKIWNVSLKVTCFLPDKLPLLFSWTCVDFGFSKPQVRVTFDEADKAYPISLELIKWKNFRKFNNALFKKYLKVQTHSTFIGYLTLTTWYVTLRTNFALCAITGLEPTHIGPTFLSELLNFELRGQGLVSHINFVTAGAPVEVTKLRVNQR